MNICSWKEDPDGFWLAECGLSFEFIDGSPKTNDYNFCPFCGDPLAQIDYVAPEAERLDESVSESD